MKALVFHGPGQRSWDTVPDPSIMAETDAIVRIDTATICGTDLHILKGDVPEVEPGTVLGHEAVGTVVETGKAVTTLQAGDRVLVSCITSCGRCRFCREGHYGLCTGGGGWILGHLIDGAAGRARTGAVRRHLRAQARTGDRRRAGALPRGHPPHRVRGRRPERQGHTGRHGRHRRSRPDRARGRDDGQAHDAGPDRRPRRRGRAAGACTQVRRRRDDQQRRDRRPRGDHGADERARSRRRHRGGRRPGDVRALCRDRQAGRARRERRRPRTGRRLSTWRSCGSRTSRSRRVSSTRRRRRGCSS